MYNTRYLLYTPRFFRWHVCGAERAYPCDVAVTLKTRAGTPLKCAINYWQPGMKHQEGGLVNTSGYTARLQVRATQRPGRVLINAKEWVAPAPDAEVPPGTVLRRVEPGRWTVVLSGSLTRSLPQSSRFELELVNDLDPDDTVSLADGVILVTPQVVANA